MGTLVVRARKLLLSATTYSLRVARSIRENAKIPGPVEARADLHRSVAQRRVGVGERGEATDRDVHRAVGDEAVDGPGASRADLDVVHVLRHLAGEHRLPRELVTASAGETLLVAVVDDRVAAGEVHQLVGEPVAQEQLPAARAGVVGLDEVAEPAHVVVAQEGRQGVGVGVLVGVPVVVAEELREPLVAEALRREPAGRVLEREVEDRLHLVVGRVVRGEGLRGGAAAVEGHLAEHEEVGVAVPLGDGLQPRAEGLPELVVDVLHGVDPEAVDVEVLDPGLVDVGHPGDHLGSLGEEVVEAEEVAVLAVLAGEGGVAAVVVHRRVVEPGRDLHILLGRVQHRRVGERGRRVERGEGGRAGEVAVVEGRAVGLLVGRGVLGDVRRACALLVADHVGGVVGDDVEEDLDAPVVGVLDESREVGVGAQVRVDLGEVGDPVAVVAGGRAVLELDRLVGEDRGQPDRVGAETLDVVELRAQALQVAAVVVALAGRVEAGDVLVPAQPALVVGRVAVGEPVAHHEVEVLVGQARPRRVPGVVAAR